MLEIGAPFVCAITIAAGTSARSRSERRAGARTTARLRRRWPKRDNRRYRRRRMGGPRSWRTAELIRLRLRRSRLVLLRPRRRLNLRRRRFRERNVDQPLNNIRGASHLDAKAKK